MVFWIFMLVMDLIVPITMLCLGRQFMKNAPKRINSNYGYRTNMSMKSQETWDFAHRYCGKVWWIMGLVMLPATLATMLFVLGEDTEHISIMGGIVCGAQLIPPLLSIIPTELALRRNFDKEGRRKQVRFRCANFWAAHRQNETADTNSCEKK